MSKRKKACLLLWCAVGMILFSACQKRTDVGEDESYIYAVNDSYTGLVKVAFEIPGETAAESMDAVLAELARPSEEIEYVQAIPETVSVQKCEVENAIAYLDFSASYLELPPLEETLTRAAVVQSLLRIPGISGVRFTVDGESLKNREGSFIGLMTEDDFVQNIGASPSSYQTDTLTLYFASQAGDKLVIETEDVKYNSNIPKEKLIVEKLMAGPKKAGAYPTINPETTLLSVTIQEGICYVNFDSEFLHNTYNIKPEVTIYSLVNSLVQGTSAERVQITVNGEKNVVYKEQIDLSQPIHNDLSWLEVTEQSAEEE